MQTLNENTYETVDTSTEVDCLTFFDTKGSQSPNDERGDTSNMDGNARVVYDEETELITTQIEDNVTFEGNNPNVFNGEGSGLFRDEAHTKVRRKAIGCKWIFKFKYKDSGEIDMYKARLVAKGFSQREGLDYEETFSHVVKMVTVRCLIVYMSLPPSYYDKNETKVCKLVKSLYGLKQAPRQWNEKLTCALIENVFIQSKNDYSLYVKSKNGMFIALLVYVDDIVITESENDKYIANMTEYQKLVGKLIYLSVTRLDIAYAVHFLSQHMNAHLQSHFTAGMRVLRYLKQAPGTGIQFNIGDKFSLHAFSYADWIAVNPVYHEKTKHFEIDLHLVREKVSFGVIKTIKIGYVKNVADVFTKGLSNSQHAEFWTILAHNYDSLVRTHLWTHQLQHFMMVYGGMGLLQGGRSLLEGGQSFLDVRNLLVSKLNAICELSYMQQNKLYSYSLASSTPSFPHGVLSEDGVGNSNQIIVWKECGGSSRCGMGCSALMSNNILGGYPVCTTIGRTQSITTDLIDKVTPAKGVVVKMWHQGLEMNCSLSVSVICDLKQVQGPKTLEKVGICDFATQITHPAGCANVLTTHGNGLGCLLCLFGAYLIAGAAYRYFYFGIRGIDIIPNLEFWISLPHRVQSLFMSLVQRFRGPSERYRSSYSPVDF
ncbi:ceroid-lipofuscinosis neuronal protein 5-like protein [Tanacetum coccineum]